MGGTGRWARRCRRLAGSITSRSEHTPQDDCGPAAGPGRLRKELRRAFKEKRRTRKHAPYVALPVRLGPNLFAELCAQAPSGPPYLNLTSQP